MIVQRITGMINNDDELMKQNWSGKTKRAEVTKVVKRAELNSVKRRTGGVLTNNLHINP